jgi:uncharacterized membrane protein YeaQ/YmgE (transglycosylase-associated protein family)
MDRIKEYLPSIGMAAAAIASVFVSAATDNHLTSDEIGNLVLATIGAFVTYFLPRLQNLQWLKPVTAAVTAGLQFALSVWGDGITMSEWSQIIATALGAVVVIGTNRQVPLYTARRAGAA